MFSIKKFRRRKRTPSPVRCATPELVIYCQWRNGRSCTNQARYAVCAGVKAQGFRW